MKYLKVLLVAIITIITFGSARAQQVEVRAQVGAPVHRHYYHHRRAIVHHRPYHRGYRHHYRRHYRHY
jgi:hypothetical protein